jgi:hypothetical protein
MRGRLETSDIGELGAQGPVKNPKRLEAALIKLIDDGVVYYEHYSTKDRAKGAKTIGLTGFLGDKPLILKKEYIPKPEHRTKFRRAVRQAKAGNTGAYEKMAKAVTYGDYHRFLNQGNLQLASNVLHDHFCENGLDVATAQGETPFKIYGDNAMLGKESAKGVKYSATTSRMSRDSIYEIARTGTSATTTQSIAARFPTWVRPKGTGDNLSLAAWHGDGGALYNFCFKKIFPDAAGFFSKSTVAAKGKLAEQVSKDDVPKIHSGEAF